MNVNNDVANIIFQQLGGQRFIAMTGANDFVGSKNALEFKIPRNKSKANYVKIELDANDTYTVYFKKYSAGGVNLKTGAYTKPKNVVLSTKNGIYCDQLCEIFTAYTGMYTNL